MTDGFTTRLMSRSDFEGPEEEREQQVASNRSTAG